MREEFAKRLTLVRKEKGITQKTAATALGVSQALLSHYEKGIRECGLNFIARASRYYDVSADYLLGLSQLRSGEAAPGLLPDPAQEPVQGRGGDLASLMGRRVVFNGVDMLYDIASSTSSKPLLHSVNNFFYLTVYKIFRLLYNANPKNEQSFFMIDPSDSPFYTESALNEQVAHMTGALRSIGADAPALGQTIIEEQYKSRAGGMLNLIKNAETLIKR